LNRSTWLRGFEIPVMVMFGPYLLGPMNDFCFSRCCATLIVVLRSDVVENIDSKDGHFVVTEILGKADLKNLVF
jgi:hypothetical protein